MLSYRHGTYTTFLVDMLNALQTQTVPDAGGTPPLAGIHLGSTDDLVLGIIRAWATVGDVLTFYQERIANEAFLPTATEPTSIIELAHMVGYQPAQALAASTYLAFTVGGGPGLPDQVTVPIGTRVQSVPGPGERPQIFETIEALPMFAEWSDLTPAPAQPGAPPPIQSGSTELMLEGINLRLSPGDLLLMVDENTYQPPIQHLVWGTELPVSVHGRYRPLGSVETIRAQQRTRVRWDTPLDGPTLARPAAFIFRKQARVFGYDAADWNTLPPERKAQLAPPVGGLFRSADAGAHWTPATGTTTTRAVRAVQFDTAGHVFAATAGDGVLRSDDGGVNWRPVNTGLVRKDVHALAIDAQGGLYAGSSGGGVMRSVDAGESWAPLRTENNVQLGRQGFSVTTTRLPNTVVRALAITGTTILAATDSGMFRATLGGNGWEALTSGLAPSLQFTSLLAIPNGPVIAGTSQGPFVSTNAGNSWSPATTGLPIGAAVVALATSAASVLAATDQGLFTSPVRAPLRWTHIGSPEGTVQALAASGNALFAGTSQGLARSTDGGTTWQSMSDGLTGQSVQAVAIGADGTQLVVAEPLTIASGDQWPGFGLPQDTVDLDATYPTVQTGSWFLVTQPDGKAGLFPVVQAQRVSRSGFGERAFVTTITTHVDPSIATFDRRTAVVYVASEPLALAVDPLSILSGPSLKLATVLAQPLVPGRAIALTGKRPRGRLAPKLTGTPQVTVDDGRKPVVLQPREIVEVLAASQKAPDGSLVWRIRHHTGVVGTVSLQPDELEWVAADAASEQVNEVLQVADCTPDDGTGHAQLTFVRAPSNVYDAATVHLNANLAMATHGETVQEVLGSGDATQSHQQFTLKRPPLTRFVLPGQLEAISTLNVWVNRLAWQPVDTLVQLDAHSRAYSIQTDKDGTVRVVFGDGARGARLPTGAENVVATYRTGAGPDGEVRPGSLAQLMTRPLGVRSVTNPVAASGAAPAEEPDQIRARASASLLPRSRIVSLRDYVEFSIGLADVARADVRLLHVRHHPVVHVTLAPLPGRSLVTDDVAAAIRAGQATPANVQVDLCVMLNFMTRVRVVANPTLLVYDLVGKVGTSLLEAFSLGRRDLAKPVAASDVVGIAQAVTGVRAVDLVAFDYAESTTPSVQPRLLARAASVDRSTGQIHPAEVLVLTADHLSVELA